MAPAPPYKRTQYLVDRDYQLRFVIRGFLVILAVALLSALCATGLVWLTLYQPELESRALLFSCLLTVSIMLLMEVLLAIPIIFFVGIRQSHRIVGPMTRLKQTLDAIGRGDFSQRIILRKGDALEELARSINQMAEGLERRFPHPPSA